MARAMARGARVAPSCAARSSIASSSRSASGRVKHTLAIYAWVKVCVPLPIGSRLDAQSGAFSWSPGVGFVGTYDLVFVRSAGGRAIARREVRFILHAKGSGHIGAQVVIDAPRAQQELAQPFALGGWAADLDAASGPGIDTLHVWAYPLTGGAPVFLGMATYGGARPDVAAIHGESVPRLGLWPARAGPGAGPVRPGGVRVEQRQRRVRAGAAGAGQRAVVHASHVRTTCDNNAVEEPARNRLR